MRIAPEAAARTSGRSRRARPRMRSARCAEGQLDDHLAVVAAAVDARRRLLRTIDASHMLRRCGGDHVRIRPASRPRHLAGVDGTIVQLDDVRRRSVAGSRRVPDSAATQPLRPPAGRRPIRPDCHGKEGVVGSSRAPISARARASGPGCCEGQRSAVQYGQARARIRDQLRVSHRSVDPLDAWAGRGGSRPLRSAARSAARSAPHGFRSRPAEVATGPRTPSPPGRAGPLGGLRGRLGGSATAALSATPTNPGSTP
jgi:hypothetical protein